MLVGPCVSRVVYILYIPEFNIRGIDTIPFSMFIPAICFGTAIFGFKILNVTPVARSAASEMMPDDAIALDPDGRVIDYNRAGGITFPALTPETPSEQSAGSLPIARNSADNPIFPHGRNSGSAGEREALRTVMEIIMIAAREDDSATRFGGEGLICVLPEQPATNARIIAERIRETIQNYETAVCGSGTTGITASIGITGT